MKIDIDGIPRILAKFSRAELIKTSPPIQRLNRISSFLGYNIFTLRDDLTGFALGGNKTRKLEYLIGDALAKKADTLVTMNATSFSRNAAAAGKMYGFEVHVLITGDESEQNQASQAIFNQYDTQLHYISKDSENDILTVYQRLVESLNAQGKAVYELHPGGSDRVGTLAYIHAFQQILEFSQDLGIHFQHIIHSAGSSGTQAGLLLGKIICGYDTDILGIAASRNAAEKTKRVQELTESTAQMLGIQLHETKITVDDSFIGPGYKVSSEEGKNAVEMFAVMEGILLDQVYTGKAAAGLIHYAKNKSLKGENILFIHTGGNSDLFY